MRLPAGHGGGPARGGGVGGRLLGGHEGEEKGRVRRDRHAAGAAPATRPGAAARKNVGASASVNSIAGASANVGASAGVCPGIDAEGRAAVGADPGGAHRQQRQGQEISVQDEKL